MSKKDTSISGFLLDFSLGGTAGTSYLKTTRPLSSSSRRAFSLFSLPPNLKHKDVKSNNMHHTDRAPFLIISSRTIFPFFSCFACFFPPLSKGKGNERGGRKRKGEFICGFGRGLGEAALVKKSQHQNMRLSPTTGPLFLFSLPT